MTIETNRIYHDITHIRTRIIQITDTNTNTNTIINTTIKEFHQDFTQISQNSSFFGWRYCQFNYLFQLNY